MSNSFGELAHLLLYSLLQPFHTILSSVDQLHCPAYHTLYVNTRDPVQLPYDLCGGRLPTWCYMLKEGVHFLAWA